MLRRQIRRFGDERGAEVWRATSGIRALSRTSR
jgi:hypothetical protein